jgi:hypothetical protein
MSGETFTPPVPGFRIGGATMQGALHVKKNLPNQDAIAWQATKEGDLPVLLAVSDGHGGSAYFRSDVGSRFAVEVALAVGNDLAQQADGLPEPVVRHEAEDRMPKRIAHEWLERVAAHLRDHPVTDEDRVRLAAVSPKALEKLERDARIAYGATLLLVVMTRRFLIFFQLGDGDILCVGEDGETRAVFDGGPDQVGEDTASLCMADAWQEFQVEIVPIRDAPPALILVSSDGYSKSFVTAADFLRVGSDYLEIFRNQGVKAVERELPKFLAEASQKGSGDDISLGFIRCLDPGDPEAQRVWRDEIQRTVGEKADRQELREQLEAVRLETSHALQVMELRLKDVRRLTGRLFSAAMGSSALLLVLGILLWLHGRG